MCPEDVKTEVEKLVAEGIDLKILDVAGQCYVLVRDIEAPNPPWDREKYDILIAIPSAYSDASLDGFYISLPYKFNNKNHPRVNGGIIETESQQWQLISWHYPDGKPWKRGQDNLDSHITHCRGFFRHRGAINDY
jgi:hypothetical protein